MTAEVIALTMFLGTQLVHCCNHQTAPTSGGNQGYILATIFVLPSIPVYTLCPFFVCQTVPCPISLAIFIAACKDNYVVYACGFDRNGKWEWFCESKLRCKNDIARMMLQKWCCKITSQTLTTLFAEGIISDYSFIIICHDMRYIFGNDFD